VTEGDWNIVKHLMLVNMKREIVRDIFCMFALDAFGRTMYVMRTNERHKSEVNASASFARNLET
jgi:hypothetical protein